MSSTGSVRAYRVKMTTGDEETVEDWYSVVLSIEDCEAPVCEPVKGVE